MFSVICYVALLTGKHLFLKKFKEIYKDISLEKEMATHSGTLAWKVPWMEEHGRLQSMGSLRVGHNWVTSVTSQRYKGFPGGTSGKQPACQSRRHKRCGLDLWIEEGTTTHSNILIWAISWTEEPCRLQPMELQRLGHYSATAHAHAVKRKRKKLNSLKLLQICFLSAKFISSYNRAWAECQQKQWKLQMCSFHSVYFSLLKHVELGKERWDP